LFRTYCGGQSDYRYDTISGKAWTNQFANCNKYSNLLISTDFAPDRVLYGMYYNNNPDFSAFTNNGGSSGQLTAMVTHTSRSNVIQTDYSIKKPRALGFHNLQAQRTIIATTGLPDRVERLNNYFNKLPPPPAAPSDWDNLWNNILIPLGVMLVVIVIMIIAFLIGNAIASAIVGKIGLAAASLLFAGTFIAAAYYTRIKERGGFIYLTPKDHLEAIVFGAIEALSWVAGSNYVKELTIIPKLQNATKIGRMVERAGHIANNIGPAFVKTMGRLQVTIGMWHLKTMFIETVNNQDMFHGKNNDGLFLMLAGAVMFAKFKFKGRLNPFNELSYSGGILTKGLGKIGISEEWAPFAYLTAGVLVGAMVHEYTKDRDYDKWGGDVKFITRESDEAGLKMHIFDFGRFLAISAHQGNVSFIPQEYAGLFGAFIAFSDMDFIAVRHMTGAIFRPDLIKLGIAPSVFQQPIETFVYYFLNPFFIYNFIGQTAQGWYLGNGINSSYRDFENKSLGYDQNYTRSILYEYGIYGLNSYNGEMVG
jgi:hypothetical protein